MIHSDQLDRRASRFGALRLVTIVIDILCLIIAKVTELSTCI